MTENEIMSIVENPIILSDFLSNGGRIVERIPLNRNMFLEAGVHLNVLYGILKKGDQIV